MPPSTKFAPPGFTTKTWWLGVVWPLAGIASAYWLRIADSHGFMSPDSRDFATRPTAFWLFPTAAHLIAALLVPAAAVVASLTRRPQLEYATLGFVVGLSGAWAVATSFPGLDELGNFGPGSTRHSTAGEGPSQQLVLFIKTVADRWAIPTFFAGFHAALVVARGGGDRSRRLSHGWMLGAALLPIVDSVSDLAAISASVRGQTTVFNIGTAPLYLVGCIVCLFAYAAVSATADKASRSATAD